MWSRWRQRKARAPASSFGERSAAIPITLTLLDLAGAVALLLWGVHMVQTGVQCAFGAGLRRFLGRALRNRFRAFVVGLGVTAILQSSTATGLMVAGFASEGLVGSPSRAARSRGSRPPRADGSGLLLRLLALQRT